MKKLLLFLIVMCGFWSIPAEAQTVSSFAPVQEALSSFLELFQVPSSHAQTTERQNDSDGDGVGDAADFCRLIPEDRDGIDDGDGCPEIPASRSTQKAPIELRPASCDHAPCSVIIEQEADLIPFLDCIFGVITNKEGTVVYGKGALECIES